VIRAAVVGGSGYVGGELLRILLGHPDVELATVVSQRLAGKRVDGAHPNLRGVTELRFTCLAELAPHDVVFLATPHCETMDLLPALEPLAPVLIDLSGDFRLRDPEAFANAYGVPHRRPELLGQFTTGLPELYRDALCCADLISAPGCMATAVILALHPLSDDGLVEPDVEVDARTGSSGSGATATDANQHAERSGAMRVFSGYGHRHDWEITQACRVRSRMTATGVEAVRGVQVVCRTTLRYDVGEPEIRAAYRRHYAAEPFVRVVAYKRGLYRLPEPKILLGSNFCDVGFVRDPAGRRLLAIAALDNLVKGGAGNAVQSLNVRMGWPERRGLEFVGLHPT
jgi:LysW-gamma-L-alpha-aminoadipyl-6-phosphate/LysW-L-glutamyl-5-phosphate reductase